MLTIQYLSGSGPESLTDSLKRLRRKDKRDSLIEAMEQNRKISIAIDGPAGAGKSTIAKLLARSFGLSYVDTGAMYRGVGLLAKRCGYDPGDEGSVAGLAVNAEFDFIMDRGSPDLLNNVYLDHEDVTAAIREPDISAYASKVSALSAVRRELVAKQKRMGERGGVVMEGRDIATVVLPAAEVKIFLTASAEERARRRHLELAEAGNNADYDEVLADIRERDHRDSTRADSPLKPAADSVIVDTDHLSINEVVRKISGIVLEKTGLGPLTA